MRSRRWRSNSRLAARSASAVTEVGSKGSVRSLRLSRNGLRPSVFGSVERALSARTPTRFDIV